MRGSFETSASLTQALWDLFPHRVMPSSVHNMAKLDQWCCAHLGPAAVHSEPLDAKFGESRLAYYVDEQAQWSKRYRVYLFKNSARAIEFKLTWG